MLSFADESDSEDGSSVLESPSGNDSNGPNVMWKSCIASLPSEEHSTGPVLLRRSPSKTNGVAPERPPATTDVCRFLSDPRGRALPQDTSTFAGISETKPSRQSPVMDAIHTMGPPPDLITSSERPKSDPSSPTKSKLEGSSPSPVSVMPEATRL
ncbi:hypothetical protein MRX96_027581 [Rhipicephalus microplus]